MASFIIEKDLIDEGQANGFVVGNKDLIEKGICKHQFRLLDDDETVYFEGRSSCSSSFTPLDYFGMDYGCTDIQYFENGKWESL